MDLRQQLETLRKAFDADIASVSSEKAWNDVRVIYLGKKSTVIALLKNLKDCTPDERKIIGKEVNDVRVYFETTLDAMHERFSTISTHIADPTVPGRVSVVGKEHPLSTVLNRVYEIFSAMGFAVAEGPEIEDEWHNFDALNIPATHPSRDMQDTFYLNQNGMLLRTHTSPVQIRTMKSTKPPIAIIAPGRVFRSDALDASHSPVFHQVEGLLVDKQVTFSHLKGVLTAFLQEMFEVESLNMRFDNSFFPFTEPSAEVHMGCIFCKGKGCKVCKGSGWIEMGGAGMVDPAVFTAVGIDPEVYSGFAFGMGIERIAMLKYDIPDMRYLYENDMRMLKTM